MKLNIVNPPTKPQLKAWCHVEHVHQFPTQFLQHGYDAYLRKGSPSPLPEFTSFLGSSGGVPTALWVTDWPLAKLADIYIERCYITRKRMGSRREWILTNQRTGNSHCGTVMDAFSRERILTLNKREWLYSFLSKWHQQTGIITTGTYSKSGVFRIQPTCSTGLSLRADSSQTGAQNLSADESNRPTT